ncbi:MAG: histidine phosphatase family protein [Burkholderiaceae bacterium]
MTELWLIRHGLTDWNRQRRFQGHRDIGLHAQGHEQARRLAGRLADAGLAAIHTSDLARARDTAAPVAARLGIAAVADAGLRERCYGDFEGRTYDEIATDFPRAYARWQAREPDFALPGGGESLRDFADRCAVAFERIARRYPGARVAAVSHGGVLDIAYRLATGLALEAPRRHELLNASINRIRFEDGRWSLIDWADIAHLDAALDDASVQSPGGSAGLPTQALQR